MLAPQRWLHLSTYAELLASVDAVPLPDITFLSPPCPSPSSLLVLSAATCELQSPFKVILHGSIKCFLVLKPDAHLLTVPVGTRLYSYVTNGQGIISVGSL